MKQRLQKFILDRQQAINTEVDKLMGVDFISKVQFLWWIVNIIVVKKDKENLRMCVNYTNLNKTSLKDSYPLPCIDHLTNTNKTPSVLS